MRLIPALLLALALSACVSAPRVVPSTTPPPRPAGSTAPPPSQPAPPPVAGFRTPEIMQGAGLGGIIREAAPAVLRRFGTPRLDTREGDMRRLQFASQACVLDVFLYPLAPGAEPVATWLEARRASDGAEVDRTACIQALSR